MALPHCKQNFIRHFANAVHAFIYVIHYWLLVVHHGTPKEHSTLPRQRLIVNPECTHSRLTVANPHNFAGNTSFDHSFASGTTKLLASLSTVTQTALAVIACLTTIKSLFLSPSHRHAAPWTWATFWFWCNENPHLHRSHSHVFWSRALSGCTSTTGNNV